MGDRAAADRVGERACQRNGVAFDRNVEVEGGAVEREVAQGAADETEGRVALLGEAEEFVEEIAGLVGQLSA